MPIGLKYLKSNYYNYHMFKSNLYKKITGFIAVVDSFPFVFLVVDFSISTRFGISSSPIKKNKFYKGLKEVL